MHELLLHELGARRVHWRYDDPSGVPEAGGRVDGRPLRAAREVSIRVRRHGFAGVS